MGLNYTIIEDCSPFYIRFTHNNIKSIIDIVLEESEKETFVKGFTHYKFNLDSSNKIMQKCPLVKDLQLNHDRVSLFVTQPGYYYRAHKDGLSTRYSINYTVKVLDDKCVTNWYDDKDLENYEIDNLPRKNSRECIGFVKENHKPLKTMTAVQGECILFNTDIFHDFDNNNSKNERMVLTLRDVDVSNVYFEDVKRILFDL
jgi:hypothetical protein